MKLIRLLRSIEWAAVFAVLLLVAAIINAYITKDVSTTIALSASALTLAFLASQASS
jgi:hypothetical protein